MTANFDNYADNLKYLRWFGVSLPYTLSFASAPVRARWARTEALRQYKRIEIEIMQDEWREKNNKKLTRKDGRWIMA